MFLFKFNLTFFSYQMGLTLTMTIFSHGWILALFDFCTYMLYILYILYISYLLYLFCIVIVFLFIYSVCFLIIIFFNKTKNLTIYWLKGKETLVVHLRPKQIAYNNVWPNSNLMIMYVLFGWKYIYLTTILLFLTCPQSFTTAFCRHGKRRDLRDPGLQKYLRIV